MKNGFAIARKIILMIVPFVLSASFVSAQAGRRSATPTNIEDYGIVPLVAVNEKNPKEAITAESIALYENGVEQKIKGLSKDETPSRIVLLVDNSQTLRTDVEKLKAAAKEFIYEIRVGESKDSPRDQIFVAAYDKEPAEIQGWTDDPQKFDESMKLFRKQGEPYLFDALHMVLESVVKPLMPAFRKTAIVIISDGLDKGSTRSFEKVLAELQLANVTVYALQIPDRTGGAFRRNQPKPEHVIQKLTEGSGGRVFDFAEAQAAAKSICDELTLNRYLLYYQPLAGGGVEERRLFITGNESVSIRAKTIQPAIFK